MITLRPASVDGPLKLLVIGAHSDDIEIGCGGTILKLLDDDPGASVSWVVLSGSPERADEARLSASAYLERAGRRNAEDQVLLESFRDGFFPSNVPTLKEYFENRLKPLDPDLIFTHYRHDRHQDHRTVSELTWNTFRNHLIVEYEILKYDGDLGQPNLYVSLTEEQCQYKTSGLVSHFISQRGKHWFSEDTFWSMLRIRGVEGGVRFAEAFHLWKSVW